MNKEFLDKILGSEFVCTCGKTHRVTPEVVEICRGAVNMLPKLLKDHGKTKPIMVCDENTYSAAGKAVEGLCEFYGVAVLSPEDLHANEKGVSDARSLIELGADVYVAVGSGTIHDITRFIAHEDGIPFISIPTAPSVDGFVSATSAMTWNGCKKSFSTCAPIAMLGDIDIVANAPMRLISSGVGDLLGKFTAIVDWKIANLLTGEYYCEYIVELEKNVLKNTIDNIDKLKKRDGDTIANLMYGLVLSGLAMEMAGVSRPASGGEHYISHLLEMKVLGDTNYGYHGEKVGVGLMIACDEYRKVAKRLESFESPRHYEFPEKLVIKMFGEMADTILAENREDTLDGVSIDVLKEKKNEILEAIYSLPTPEKIVEWLGACGAPTSLEEIKIPNDFRDDICFWSPFVRNKLTFMRLSKII